MSSFESVTQQKYETLSPGKKKVAQYLLSNLEQASYSTIVDIQQATRVSETTVIRLAYALGYSGFSHMQQAIQEHIMKKRVSVSEESDIEPESHPLKTVVEKDVQLMRQTLESLSMEEFDRASQHIIDAKRVLVVGYHTSHASALWFAQTLGILRENVQLVTAQNEYENLLNVDEDTLVIAISFPRYRKQTYDFLKKAIAQHAQSIAITDSLVSPIGRLATLSLLTNTNRDESGYNSIAPALSFLNLLIISVRSRSDQQMTDRLKRLEEFYHQDDTVFE